MYKPKNKKVKAASTNIEQRAGDPFVHQDSLLPGDR